jgi:hypothetical protein
LLHRSLVGERPASRSPVWLFIGCFLVLHGQSQRHLELCDLTRFPFGPREGLLRCVLTILISNDKTKQLPVSGRDSRSLVPFPLPAFWPESDSDTQVSYLTISIHSVTETGCCAPRAPWLSTSRGGTSTESYRRTSVASSSHRIELLAGPDVVAAAAAAVLAVQRKYPRSSAF